MTAVATTLDHQSPWSLQLPLTLIAKEIKGTGKAEITVLVGDDDSSTIARLRACVGEVTKQSDISHCKRSFTSKLYEIRDRQKECKQLSKKVNVCLYP